MATKTKSLFPAMTAPASLSDFFKPFTSGFTLPPVTTAPVATRTQTLPNGGGSYSTPSGQAMSKPIYPTPDGNAPSLSSVAAGKAPAVAPTTKKVGVPPVATAPAQSSPIPPQWVKPDDTFYTPAEIANNIATAAPGAPNGDIPKFAGDTLTQGPQTTEELQQSAAGLNNSRNDIATGETDPYNVASKSGINYTPAEQAAIEKAYAGIYDPAINTALSKLDTKQKQDAADADNKSKLEQMAQQHLYDVELKKTPSGDSAATTGLTNGAYVPGANPAVDSWAQRIYDGTAKITDIPASDKGMRNAVTVALTTLGNSLSGGPTTTELGTAALANANDLLSKFDAGSGTSAVGASRIFGGSAAFPGSAKANFVNDFDALKSQLALEGVKYLKGQGSVSDAERALLSQAVTKLNLSQSEPEFRSTLTNIINTLNGGSVVTAPDGTPVQITD